MRALAALCLGLLWGLVALAVAPQLSSLPRPYALIAEYTIALPSTVAELIASSSGLSGLELFAAQAALALCFAGLVAVIPALAGEE